MSEDFVTEILPSVFRDEAKILRNHEFKDESEEETVVI
jgi:hypothetical protein